ncbi:hypothetical protein F5Y02DRAFT_417483 [Annulohypoxylon stygium]|nr:hypothetical protein F5Y02DRAFT_417483 [Annulohypoxylon stygium]
MSRSSNRETRLAEARAHIRPKVIQMMCIQGHYSGEITVFADKFSILSNISQHI